MCVMLAFHSRAGRAGWNWLIQSDPCKGTFIVVITMEYWYPQWKTPQPVGTPDIGNCWWHGVLNFCGAKVRAEDT